jgi:hypothetical protein
MHEPASVAAANEPAWRERFIRACVGSTRVAEGLYAHDWQSFLDQWVAEMQHLEAHRIAHRNC